MNKDLIGILNELDILSGTDKRGKLDSCIIHCLVDTKKIEDTEEYLSLSLDTGLPKLGLAINLLKTKFGVNDFQEYLKMVNEITSLAIDKTITSMYRSNYVLIDNINGLTSAVRYLILQGEYYNKLDVVVQTIYDKLLKNDVFIKSKKRTLDGIVLVLDKYIDLGVPHGLK